MECPFELPVRVEDDKIAGFNIVDKNGEFVQWHATKARADYIVQAINCHEKLVELLRIAKCPNSECQDGAIPHQVGEQEWEAEQCQWCDEKKQALKQAEKL